MYRPLPVRPLAVVPTVKEIKDAEPLLLIIEDEFITAIRRALVGRVYILNLQQWELKWK
jgi:hypothetical protein